MKILFEDDFIFAIDKPAGFFVHPPEKSKYPTPPEKICLYVLRDLFQQEVFPVHRLDGPTSGIVIFSKDRNFVKPMSILFQERKMTKTYWALARGFLPDTGVIEHDLDLDEGRWIQDARTEYRRLDSVEIPATIGKRYSTARYSLVEVSPITGRWHQIRRHFDRIAHPLVGDIEHGDTYHNRYFRDELKLPGLWLRAMKLEFVHPWTQRNIVIDAGADTHWRKMLQQLFPEQHLLQTN